MFWESIPHSRQDVGAYVHLRSGVVSCSFGPFFLKGLDEQYFCLLCGSLGNGAIGEFRGADLLGDPDPYGLLLWSQAVAELPALQKARPHPGSLGMIYDCRHSIPFSGKNNQMTKIEMDMSDNASHAYCCIQRMSHMFKSHAPSSLV